MSLRRAVLTTRGTTQIAIVKPPLSRSINLYALTQHARKGSTNTKQCFLPFGSEATNLKFTYSSSHRTLPLLEGVISALFFNAFTLMDYITSYTYLSIYNM